jgi:hypothetical protein
MVQEFLKQNAVNAVIQLEITEDGVAVDISSCTTKDLVFQKPDGQAITKAGSFTTDGIDGKLRYITEAGFLDQAGRWLVEAALVFPLGYGGRTKETMFIVKPIL